MVVPMRDKPQFGGEIPWIRIEDLDGKYVSDSKTGQNVSDETILRMGLKVFPRGTVLCSCSCRMGTTAIVDKPLVSNQTFIGVLPGRELSSEFLYYALQAASENLQSTATGAIQQYLSRDDFQRLRLRAPGIAHQVAIASFLDNEVSKIDALLNKKIRLIDLIAEKRSATIQRAVTQGLNPDAPSVESRINWLGRIPSHWRVIPLKLLSGIQSGITVGKKHSREQILIARPYLRVGNVQDGYLSLQDISSIDVPLSEVQRYELRPGDVVVTEGGDFDKLARGYVWEGEIEGCLHQNHIFAVRPIQSRLRSRFLAALMTSNYGRNYFTATSVQSTNLACTNRFKLGGFPVPLPPPEEQASICRWLDNSAAQIQTATEKLGATIDRLREYRSEGVLRSV